MPSSELPLAPASVDPIPDSADLAQGETPAPVEAVPVYRLVATAGLLSGRTFTVGPSGLTIGRDPATCQVVVADDEISRLHAWIGINQEGEVVIRDPHSANGTYVNRVRVKEKVLHPTDEICFGGARRHLFRIERIEDPGALSGPGEGSE